MRVDDTNTVVLYVKDLSIRGFWYLQGSWN